MMIDIKKGYEMKMNLSITNNNKNVLIDILVHQEYNLTISKLKWRRQIVN